VDNIEMDLTETGCENVDWIHVAQDRVQCWTLEKTVLNLQIT